MFEIQKFMPHGHCYLWTPSILWSHVVSDGAIALAYFSIPVAFAALILKRKQAPFKLLYLLFASFIFLCGVTHIFNIITTWEPYYQLEAVVKVVTAGVSVATAVAFWPLIPKFVRMPSQSLFKQKCEELDHLNKQLTKKVNEFDTLASLAPIGIWMADSMGNARYLNKAWLDMVGLEEVQALGDGWLRAIYEEDREVVLTAWLKSIHSTSVFDEQIRYVKSDGKILDVQVCAKPIFDDNHARAGYIGVSLDVTQLKENQQKLVESARLATLGEVAGGIAHEINNPMAVIDQNSQLVKTLINTQEIDLKIKNEILDSINNIRDTVERIKKITNALVYLGRDTQGDVIEKVNLSEAAQDALDICEQKLQMSDIKIEFAPDFNQYNILAKPVELSQVILNLVVNSAHAIRNLNEKWICFSADKEENITYLRVTDSGLGIPEEIREKMFNAFFTTKAIGQGTGLGLNISRKLIEAMGGTLGVDESAPNTTFVIKLPTATKIE